MQTASLIFAFFLSWCHFVKCQGDPWNDSKAKPSDKIQIVGLVMVTFVTAGPGQDCNTVCNKELSDLLERLRNPVTAKEDFLHMLSSQGGHQVTGKPKQFFIDECLFYRRFCIGVADVWIAIIDTVPTVRKDVFGESVEMRLEEMERLKAEAANIEWSHSSAAEINSWASSFKICLCERILYIPQVRVTPTKANIARNSAVEDIDCGHDAICQRLNAKFFAVKGNEWFCKKGIRVEHIPVSKKHPEPACACSAFFSNRRWEKCLADTDVRVASIRAQMGPEQVTSYQSSAMYEGTVAEQAVADSVDLPFTWPQTSIASGSGTNANDQQEFLPGVNDINTGQDLDSMSWLLFDSQQEVNVAYDTVRHQEPDFEAFPTVPLGELTGQSASIQPMHMDFAATAEIDPANSAMYLEESELVSLQSLVQAPPRSRNHAFGASEQIIGEPASYGMNFARFAEGDQLHFQNNPQMQLTSLDAYSSFMPSSSLPVAMVQPNVEGLSNSVRPVPHTHGASTSDRPIKIPELKRKRDAQSLPVSQHLTREAELNRLDLSPIHGLQQSSLPAEQGFDWLLGEVGSTRSSDGLEAIVGPFASSSDLSRRTTQNENDGTGDTNSAEDPFQYDFL